MRRGFGVGVFFIAAGVLFFLDAVDAIELRAAYLWPLLLIGLGLAIMLGGWARRREPPEEPVAEEPREEAAEGPREEEPLSESEEPPHEPEDRSDRDDRRPG